MRSQRQHKVDLAVARALQLAAPYLLPDSVLKADAGRLTVPRATESELEDAIRYHDSSRRLTSVPSETELKWELNDQGRAWLTANS